MAKIGRNDPCPCGSATKYKKCCEARDQAVVALRARAAAHDNLTLATPSTPATVAEFVRAAEQWVDDEDDLDQASNAVVDLVREGRLDEAERAANDLLRDYPEVHDGLERLAMVYETRGDNARALEMYRRALDFVDARKDDYDPEIGDLYRKRIRELEAPTPQ